MNRIWLSTPASDPSLVAIGPLTFDRARLELRSADGARIDLRHQSCKVLARLLKTPGDPVSKDDLLADCWPTVIVTEDSLTRCISDIRQALGPLGREVIRTVPKLGYVYLPPRADEGSVSRASEPDHGAGPSDSAPGPAPAPDETAVPNSPVGRFFPSDWTKPARLIAAAVLLAVLLVALVRGYGFSWRDDATHEPTLIAVRPLANLGGDPALQYFADGTTEVLVSTLARSPEIRIAGGTLVDSILKDDPDPRRIRSELGAAFLLTGSVQKRADGIRLIAELIDTGTGEHVWGERYDRTGSDPFAVQDGIVEDIIRTVAGDYGLITRRQYRDAWGKDQGSLAEYDYYLRGHSVFMTFTPEGLDESERIWTEGLKRFPNSSLLKVKLAYVGFVRVQSGWVADPLPVLAESWRLGSEAIADPNRTPFARVMSHMLMSELNFYYRKDYAQAMKERALVLDLSPNDFFMIANLAYIAVGAGEPQVAIESLKDITPHQPMADWGYAALAWAHFAVGDYEASIRAARAPLNPIPAYADAFEAASLVLLGRKAEAEAAFARLKKALPDLSADLIRELHPNADESVVQREIEALKGLGLKI